MVTDAFGIRSISLSLYSATFSTRDRGNIGNLKSSVVQHLLGKGLVVTDGSCTLLTSGSRRDQAWESIVTFLLAWALRIKGTNESNAFAGIWRPSTHATHHG